mgnify:CR=1 FL=1|jgi:hypothetical protein
MNNQGESLSFLDLITLVSFVIGLANYSENIDQGQMQGAISGAVGDLHNHLGEQDSKIEEILSLLKGGSSSDERQEESH